jgi:hypothetical protein
MSERRYYNVLTYCSRPNCLREAKYALIDEGLLLFRCPECRSVGL